MPREPQDSRPVRFEFSSEPDAELEWLLCLAAGIQFRKHHLAELAAGQAQPGQTFLDELQNLLETGADSPDADSNDVSED